MLELYNLVLILGFKLSIVWPVKWDIIKAFLGSVECFMQTKFLLKMGYY